MPSRPAVLPTARTFGVGGVVAAAFVVLAPLGPASAARPAAVKPVPVLQLAASYALDQAIPVAPGVAVTSYQSPATVGDTDSAVTTANLAAGGVSANVLVGGVTNKKTVAAWSAATGAVAAVNGDYFAITGSQAPLGPVIKGGRTLKAGLSPYPVVGEGTDGVLRAATAQLNGFVGWRTNLAPMTSYNSDVDGSPASGSLAVFDSNWGSGPVWATGLGPSATTIVTDSHHRLVKAYKGVPHGLRVPSHGAVLVTSGSYSGMRNLHKGTVVNYRAGVATTAAMPYEWALGHGLTLMTAGKVVHNAPAGDTDPHDSRTAIGWKDGGRTLMLVTSTRAGLSVGQGANEIADELAAMGATDGVLLDGGGSTTLQARTRGAASATPVQSPVDAGQRPVPIGIGIFVPKGNHVPAGFDVDVDDSSVFAGLTRRATVVGYDNWWGPATVDPGSVSYAGATAGTISEPAPGLIRTAATDAGPVSVVATSGSLTSTTTLSVLPPLASISGPPSLRLDPGGATQTLTVIGHGATGALPVDSSDVVAAVDPATLGVGSDSRGRLVLKAPKGSSGVVGTLSLAVGSAQAGVTIHDGWHDVAVTPTLGQAHGWGVHGAALSATPTPGRGGGIGLQVAIRKGGHASLVPMVTAPMAGAPLPGGSVRVGLWVRGDGRQHTVTVTVAGSGGAPRTLELGVVRGRSWTLLDATLPALGVPVVTSVGITGPTHGAAGTVLVSGLVGRL